MPTPHGAIDFGWTATKHELTATVDRAGRRHDSSCRPPALRRSTGSESARNAAITAVKVGPGKHTLVVVLCAYAPEDERFAAAQRG